MRAKSIELRFHLGSMAPVLFFCLMTQHIVIRANDSKIGLPQLVAMALAQDPTLRSASLEAQAKRLAATSANRANWPSLALTSKHGLSESNPSVATSPFTSQLGLEATAPLYTNGAESIKKASAEQSVKLAEQEMQAAREKLAFAVSQAFLKLSQAIETQKVQQAQFQLIEKKYKSIEQQHKQGVKTRREYLRFRSELRRAQIDLNLSQVEAEKARVELLKNLGLPDQVNSIATEEVASHDPQLPEGPPALATNPQSIAMESQRAIFQNDFRLVKEAQSLTIKLTADASLNATQYLGTGLGLPGSQTSGWSFLLTAEMNLWDWGIRRRKTEIAAVNLAQEENRLESKRIDLRVESQKLMGDLKESSLSLSLSRELMELETRNFSEIENDYFNGRIAYSDLVLALRDLLSAKVKLIASYFAFRTQILKYHLLQGRLAEHLGLPFAGS